MKKLIIAFLLYSSFCSSQNDTTMLTANYYSKKGEHNKAIQICKKVIQRDTNNLVNYMTLALLYENAQSYYEAISTYNLIIARDSSYYPAYCAMGALFLNTNLHSQAISFFSKAIGISSHENDAYRGRALALLQMEDFENAVKDYNVLLTKDRVNLDKASCLLQRGYCYLRMDKITLACMDFDEASKLSNKEADEYLKKYCSK